MLLGPVDVKSWRVYQIFKYGTVKRVVCTGLTQTSTMYIHSRQYCSYLFILAREQHAMRPNKITGVFRVTGLNILGRVGTHICFLIIFFQRFFFSGKK